MVEENGEIEEGEIVTGKYHMKKKHLFSIKNKSRRCSKSVLRMPTEYFKCFIFCIVKIVETMEIFY